MIRAEWRSGEACNKKSYADNFITNFELIRQLFEISKGLASMKVGKYRISREILYLVAPLECQ